MNVHHAGFAPHLAVAATGGDFGREFLAGMREIPKCVSAKYLYDERGSELFEQICKLPEYYVTRTEMSLLTANADEFARLMGPGIELIEFGAGALRKVRTLLEALPSPRAFVPIDISGDYLHEVSDELSALYPGLAVRPLVADFTRPLAFPQAPAAVRRVGFFPGSTIGNLEHTQALAFLRRAAQFLKGGGLLIGVDLVKDPAILHAAYNDASGVTAAFNKNMLARANRDLDGNFDLHSFAHYAFYHPILRRVEMHLVSLVTQRVQVAGRTIAFDEGETIHTENSHKYTVEGFRKLASSAGFVPRKVWCDPERLFSLHWLEA